MTQLTKNIVLVHGGFVDGSGWEGVYNLLKKDGYNVAIVQNPTISGLPNCRGARPPRVGKCNYLLSTSAGIVFQPTQSARDSMLPAVKDEETFVEV